MPSSRSSSAQQARQHLADQLREIREDTNLTGRKLAELVGWSPQKVSRIEHGARPISAEDLRTWCRACGVPRERIDALLAERRDVAGMWTTYRRLHRSGLRQAQSSVRPIYERASVVRFYQPSVIPGLLQTEDYTAAALTAVRAALRLGVDDVAEAVAERIARQSVLHHAGKRFLFVIEEQVLHARVCAHEAHAGQLRHICELMSLPTVSLGIIPQAAERTGVWPEEAFTMFDSELVAVELVSGILNITQPGEIGLYSRAFAAFNGLAVHGEQVRKIIAGALDALNQGQSLASS